jgi:hypothetical protein
LQRLFGILRVKLQQIDGEPGAEIERNNNIPNAKQASLLLSVTEQLPQYQPIGYTLTQAQKDFKWMRQFPEDRVLKQPPDCQDKAADGTGKVCTIIPRSYLSVTGRVRRDLTLLLPHSAQVAPDQAGHLDHFYYGLLMLLNFMDSAWFGIYTKSGGAVHALKQLEEAEFATFIEQLPLVPSAKTPGTKLIDTMKGLRTKKENTAWRFYAGARLKAAGFGDIWERKYLEVPELAGCIGSFSEFHFGCR